MVSPNHMKELPRTTRFSAPKERDDTSRPEVENKQEKKLWEESVMRSVEEGMTTRCAEVLQPRKV